MEVKQQLPFNKDLSNLNREANSSKSGSRLTLHSPADDINEARETNLNTFNLDSNYQFNFGFQNNINNIEIMNRNNQLSNVTLGINDLQSPT